MIQMICGATRVNGTLMTSANGPFRAEEAVEQRLIAKGVARAVETVRVPDVVEPTAQETLENETAESEPEADAAFDEEQLAQLTLARLRALAKDMEIDTAGLKSKADFAKAITAADIGTEDIPAMDAADSIIL